MDLGIWMCRCRKETPDHKKKLLFDDSDKFRRKGLGLGGNNRRKGKQLTMEFVKPKQQQEETRVKYSKFQARGFIQLSK